MFGWGVDTGAAAFETCTSSCQAGIAGSGVGQFAFPGGVAIDSNDRIIVAGNTNDRVQIFDSAGNHLDTFGSFGTGNGQFNSPVGIAVDSNDRIIVADAQNFRIQIFNSAGITSHNSAL